MTIPDPATRRGRRWGPAALAGAAALALAYVGAWFGTAAIVRAQATRFIEAQRASGVAITHGAMTTAGFPGPIRVTLPQLAIAAPIAGGGWTWQTPGIALVTWPLRWHVLDIDLAGTHRIAGMATLPDVPLWVRTTTANAHLRVDLRGRLTAATLSATGFSVALSESGDPLLRIGTGEADAALVEPPVASSTNGVADAHPPTGPVTARVRLTATDVSPPPLPVPIVRPITQARLTAELTGAMPSGPLPQVLEAWRSGGGTVEIKDALLDWPPVRIAASGTLALDRALQPVGAASLRIQGGAEVMDLLVSAGVLGEAEAGVAKVGLTLMSRRNADGVPELTVPLALQDGDISAGPLPLGKLRPIGWPQIAVP